MFIAHRVQDGYTKKRNTCLTIKNPEKKVSQCTVKRSEKRPILIIQYRNHRISSQIDEHEHCRDQRLTYDQSENREDRTHTKSRVPDDADSSTCSATAAPSAG